MGVMAMMLKAPAAGAANYDAAVLSLSGLVNFYKFEDASGATATDSAGSNPGTISGSGVTLGATGLTGAGTDFSFNGSGSVTSSTAWALGAGGAFSVVLLCKFTTVAASPGLYSLFQFGNPSSSGVALMGDNSFGWELIWNNSSVPWGGFNPAAATLYHVALTYDGTNANSYVNAAIATSASAQPAPSSSGGWKVGGGFGSPGGLTAHGFQGTLGHVAVFNRALTSGEVSTLYAAR